MLLISGILSLFVFQVKDHKFEYLESYISIYG